MAKKNTITTDEAQALKALLDRAKSIMDGKMALQFGKEFAMLLAWMQQKGFASAIDQEEAKVYLAASQLRNHPKELEQVVAYYDMLQQWNICDNFKGFEVKEGNNGAAMVRFLWYSLEPPKGKTSD